MQRPRTTVIIPAAGAGTRMGGGTAKQFLPLRGMPILARTLALFAASPRVDGIILVVSRGGMAACRRVAGRPAKLLKIIEGGSQRQDSVYAGLCALPDDTDLVVVHDAVRPLLPAEALEGILAAAVDRPAQVMAVPVHDTIKVADGGQVLETPDRSRLWAAQTPQVFAAATLREAHERARADGFVGTDDASLVERLGHPVYVYTGTPENLKITTAADMDRAAAILARREAEQGGGLDARGAPLVQRVGFGYDVHRLAPGRQLVLGGVHIDYSEGLVGHSDADVLTHAVMDALLGAAGLRDIGNYFPDTDPAYAGADSVGLLARVMELLADRGLRVVNVDCTVVAERPKLAPYMAEMQGNLGRTLGTGAQGVAIKATTGEGMGFAGRGEGIAAYAVAAVLQS